jgi:translation initiation factor eIF-2B subunit beta
MGFGGPGPILKKKVSMVANSTKPLLSASKSMSQIEKPVLNEKEQKQKERMIRRRKKFLDIVLLNLQTMKDDNERVYEAIQLQAHEHINKNDIVLTFSQSDLLQSFLEAAYKGVDDNGEVAESRDESSDKGKDFEVYVCETAPSFKGHQTAKKLQEDGLKVSLVTDASVFAIMSIVDKVIISTHGIMANGGLIATAGAYQICLAAKVSNKKTD